MSSQFYVTDLSPCIYALLYVYNYQNKLIEDHVWHMCAHKSQIAVSN